MRTLHLPRRCSLVSHSSPQRRHIGSSFILSKVRCRINVLCPVRRPTKIFKSGNAGHGTPSLYFIRIPSLQLTGLPILQIWLIFGHSIKQPGDLDLSPLTSLCMSVIRVIVLCPRVSFRSFWKWVVLSPSSEKNG